MIDLSTIPEVADAIVLLPEQKSILASYASRLGVSPQECLNEAIEDWIIVVATARLGEVSQNEKPYNLIVFSTLTPENRKG